jgi:hypothetical protein
VSQAVTPSPGQAAPREAVRHADGPASREAAAPQPAVRWLRPLPPRLRALLWPLSTGICAHLAALLLALGVASATRQAVQHLLSAWDSRWYLLAASGYPHHILPGSGNAAQSALGFFPLLPLLVRVTHLALGVGYFTSGLLVSSAASIAAPVAVWWALRGPVGTDGAVRGTALVFFSPGAFVLVMVYSEALLVTAVALCLVALQRRKWLTAGLLAAAASATDPLGLAALAPCLVVAWHTFRREGSWRPFVAPALAPAGAVGFFAFLWAWVGTPFAWFITQRRGWQGGPLFDGIPKAFSIVVEHGFVDVNDTVKTVSVFAVLALLAFFLRCRPDRALLAYVLVTLALAVASPIVSLTPRVVLRAFPLLGVVGAKVPRRLLPVLVGTSALVMAALAASSWGLGRVPYTP